MIAKIFVSFLFLFQWSCYAREILPEQTNKTVVDLSNKNLTNENFFISMQHDQRIKINEAHELILRGNQIDRFVDCAVKMNSSLIQTLDLSHNKLTKFFFVCYEYNLTTLNISHNQIDYLNDEALTPKVMKLKRLDVSYNNLYVVNYTMLEHMKNLEFLSLASNPIGDNIDEDVFLNMTNLKHLNLKNISSTFFPPRLFQSLTNLEWLDLSDNPIEEVPPLPSSIRVLYIGGTKISQINSLVMPHLRVLNLDHSVNLTSILMNKLENPTELEELSIRNSPNLAEIREIRTSMMLLPNLKRLYLQNCGLRSLPPILRPIFEKTAVIEIQNNPWNCDCNMKWINSLNMTNDLIQSFRCKSPIQHENKTLHDIPNDELVCEIPGDFHIHHSMFYIPLVVCLIGLSLSIFVYLSRNCLRRWAMKIRHRGSGTVSYANVVNENDLVRILPTGETNDHMEI